MKIKIQPPSHRIVHVYGEEEAYSELACRVIIIAIRDWVTESAGDAGNARSSKNNVTSAEEYIFSNTWESLNDTFGFRHLCKIFNIPIGRARTAIRKQRKMKRMGLTPPILEKDEEES